MAGGVPNPRRPRPPGGAGFPPKEGGGQGGGGLPPPAGGAPGETAGGPRGETPPGAHPPGGAPPQTTPPPTTTHPQVSTHPRPRSNRVELWMVAPWDAGRLISNGPQKAVEQRLDSRANCSRRILFAHQEPAGHDHIRVHTEHGHAQPLRYRHTPPLRRSQRVF